MASICNLHDFLQAAGEAATDFANMSLCHDSLFDFSKLELIHNEMELPSMGSCVDLKLSDTLITIGILSTKDNLMSMAKSMMGITSNQDISNEDMMDAINEMINIIAGGVKSRLNEKLQSNIKLGLPIFIELDWASYNKNRLVGKLSKGDIPLYLLVSSH